MAVRRLRQGSYQEVELSPSMRALVTEREVLLFDRQRQAVALTLREAQVLAKVVGGTDKVDLEKTL